ncbi:type III-A CRISPR-associated protein Csm2 [bacterium]|nr:type III-A CRISPR-associated protein Csm2 [bacterium]
MNGYQKNRGREQYKPSFDRPILTDPELLGTPAEKLAKNVCERLSSNQLRKFYSEVKNLQQQFSNDELSNKRTWEKVFPQIKLVKAKVMYNSQRDAFKNNHAYQNFCFFLSHYIDKVGSDFSSGYPAFQKFVQLFEAVVGYGSQYTNKS